MQFDWTVRTLKEWNQYYSLSLSANWMQTWAYAQASLKADYLSSKMALILENGIPVGMMCVQSIKLGPLQVINLKRGPLWFEETTSERLLQFAQAFRKEFPRSLFQRLRWMPEFDFTNESPMVEALTKIGFKLRKEKFITSWLDLTASEEDLRKQLCQKWRNCLHKAEKQNLNEQTDLHLKNLGVFFSYYTQHVQTKKYQGPTLRFLSEEFTELSKTGAVCFIWAKQDKKPVAGLSIVFHGPTASYRLGWNTEAGRKSNAHYLLIWKALLFAKSKGCLRFDIGGLLPDEAPGITHFKKGLGGQISQSITLS